MSRGTLFFEDFAVGQRFTSGGRTVTDADIRLYLGATGTAHPNHTDEEYCRRHPILEGVCAPGVLVLGLVDAFIAETVTQQMTSSMNYGHDKVRYVRPVYTRDTVHAEIEIVECAPRDEEWGLVKLEARAVNQRGEAVLFDAHVIVVQRRLAALDSIEQVG
ncbi:MaoC/PaaZ C-terminal domain-containing protein [Conexibacter stalactiti]|uniref:MaoC/PaaZ C-terminal domain-containing protein n=1 Tax=Conexibacter stalactiti TaxID=1940611 RepID=A0ABU4HVS1_9ACTN|nr:MaoC/PaaZ C-terminal domain-containing protein [Conexibacter stalactiti]MDW5597422.1 MaoC/PaaZ C-terminal domain-containing protein [Conexibacter stalactiti]MEC5038064.1 MaoC/PaaZ C-terminal domain-containing protein [Conexibacter stalactiti]